jgi:hypothetical protein
MSRSLTATDRSRLIRLASTLPKGSDERKAILASLGKKAGYWARTFGPTMGRFYDELEAWASRASMQGTDPAGASIVSFYENNVPTALKSEAAWRAFINAPTGFDVRVEQKKVFGGRPEFSDIKARLTKIEKSMLKITQIPGIKSAGAPYCWEFAEWEHETEDLYFAIDVKLDPSYFTDAVREEMLSHYRG